METQRAPAMINLPHDYSAGKKHKRWMVRIVLFRDAKQESQMICGGLPSLFLNPTSRLSIPIAPPCSRRIPSQACRIHYCQVASEGVADRLGRMPISCHSKIIPCSCAAFSSSIGCRLVWTSSNNDAIQLWLSVSSLDDEP